MRPSHSACIVAVRETPLHQLSSLPQEALAIRSLHAPPICIDRLLFLGFAFPMPLPRLSLLRDVRPYFHAVQVCQHCTTVVAVVGDHFFDALQMHSWFL